MRSSFRMRQWARLLRFTAAGYLHHGMQRGVCSTDAADSGGKNLPNMIPCYLIKRCLDLFPIGKNICGHGKTSG